MKFPALSDQRRAAMLEPPAGRTRVLLDTDTYNEVDDQFALVQMMRSTDRFDVEAIHAAPFHNSRSSGPADGMAKSYEEILRLLQLLEVPPEGLVFRGSTAYLADLAHPVESEAAANLVARAMANDERPLYVLAIGAITNVASAILLEPKIVERVVIVWLGGNEFHHPTASEFNLKQDPVASRLVFDCGVPLVHIPCQKVTSHLLTTLPELEHYLKGKSALGTYLYEIVRDYGGGYAWSKVIWDVAAVSWVLDPSWVPSALAPSPMLNDDLTWSRDDSRHVVRTATHVRRDRIFADVFAKVTGETPPG